MRDVLTRLTGTLLELFEKDQVRATIESTYLDDIMQKLRNLDDACLEDCIPDELIPDILDLAEMLATAADYYDDNWVDSIQSSACRFHENIDRVKCGKSGKM